jgi:hypothetical protein
MARSQDEQRGTLRVRWLGGQAEVEIHNHPTDSLLQCECGDTCAGDSKAMADFIEEHTRRHAAEGKGPGR